MFTADGGFRYDETGRLSAHPRVYGTYAVDGDTISVDIEGGSAGCAGQTIALRAVVSAKGPLHVLPVGSDPSSCGAPFAPQWVLEQVLPAGYLRLAPEPSRSSTGTRWPATTPCWATGTTRRAATSSSCGTTGPTRPSRGSTELADSGTWTVDPSVTRLTLVSGADSPTCREGDRFVLDNLRAQGRRRPRPPGRPRTQRLRRGVAGHRVVPPGPVTRGTAMSPRSGTGHHVHGDRGADPSVGRRRPRR